jgi:ubiquinone/menaquinone biosynthesis C-methylase UbiE
MTDPWATVDRSEDPAGMVDVQRAFSTTDFALRYKQRSYELVGIAPGKRVLDVGSGPGVDLAQLESVTAGAGFAVGLDRSLAMARAAPLLTIVGDVLALPFRSEVFDAVRADRVLQHLDDAGAALQEMARVARPGAWLVVCDPDQRTLEIELEDAAVAEGLEEFRRASWPSGNVARDMPALMTRAGLESVTAEEFRYDVHDLHWAFGLETWPAALHTQGRLSERERDRWEAVIDQSRAHGHFRYAVSFFVTAGRTRT